MVEDEIGNMVIEDMKASDLQQVVAIEMASCTMPWSETSFFNELNNPRSVAKLARIDGQIAGYICANTILDEGHVRTLAVALPFRRRGIASALVRKVIEYIRSEGCRFVFLEVRVSNENARKMYERLGFNTVGIRKNYYVSPVEDAFLMSLKFEG